MGSFRAAAAISETADQLRYPNHYTIDFNSCHVKFSSYAVYCAIMFGNVNM